MSGSQVGETVPALDPDDRNAVMAFIRANTKILSPPLVPELRLHLAEESLPIWQKTEEELQQDNIPPPFWAFAWAGGQALARYLLDHREIVAGKRVLDIGTGSGMTAIAAKLAGAAHVTASDIDTLAVTAVELNAALNEVSLKVISQDVLCEPMPSFDVFIVADLFYERALAESVMVFCQKAKQQGATVLIGDPKRNYFPVDAFTCLETYQVDVTRELEDTLIKRTGVWRL